MKTMLLNNKVIKLYDSIDEMPIMNFQKYNKYLLIDSGIGSDADDIDAHIVKVAQFINAKNNKKALQELQNMRQALYMINNEISPKYLAFAALIQSIDGKEVIDLSDDNLKAILQSLKELKHSKIVKFLLWLKKKVATELEAYFPGDFNNAKEKDAYDKVKQRTQLILESIVTGEDKSKQIDMLDIILLNFYTPKSFLGRESVEIQYDKQFENTCVLIAQKTSLDAKKMTVLQYYSTLETIKKQAEAEIKAYKCVKK